MGDKPLGSIQPPDSLFVPTPSCTSSSISVKNALIFKKRNTNLRGIS
jgi:hypothetical protein